MKKVTLGGDRLGSGKRMQVDLHGYERSTHNLSKIWRNTQAPGTIVPCYVNVALPGDTWDIDLEMYALTHPTIGPLFGSYTLEAYAFFAPIRLYQGKLHNNAIGIGRNMANIKLPTIDMVARKVTPANYENIDNAQINPSCIFPYLGIRGVGYIPQAVLNNTVPQVFQAATWLAYWDIYKNYFANKQEEVGAVIHTPRVTTTTTVDSISIDGVAGLTQYPALSGPFIPNQESGVIAIQYIGTAPKPEEIKLFIDGAFYPLLQFFEDFYDDTGAAEIRGNVKSGLPILQIQAWDYIADTDQPYVSPRVQFFPLENIDTMRNEILAHATASTAFDVGTVDLAPYNYLTIAGHASQDQLASQYLMTQEGLAVKTYKSDLFNNWLQTDWIDGVDGITEITSIDTSGGSFSIDTLNLSKKVYMMLNRIAVSGGTYKDWIEAVYDHTPFTGIESPVFHGGLIREIVFQEVVSNSATADQPLGTLAGRGVLGRKKKGGKIRIKADEHGFIMILCSITPNIDYSQGNEWWATQLYTMDDFHKPQMDQIGFQELLTGQMAWWDVSQPPTTIGLWINRSAGKQPAWTNYMTNINTTHGNFAVKNNEMFMTLNRLYEFDPTTQRIKDLTTYIDPVKYNQIFAQTSIDAMNFWVQMGIDAVARRKMSAKIMPNL